jgi:hypothetical protein
VVDRHRLRILSALALALALGCAHVPAEAPPSAEPAVVQAPAPPPVMRPQSQLEARALLQRAFEASAGDRVGEAVRLISAVLATDFLTDQGRANLYWLVADGHLRAGSIESHFDSLGMFLLAAELLEGEIDADLNTRRLLARSALAARRVAADPDFGRRPEKAIDVEDIREPNRILAALPCGPAGEGRFVDVRTEAHDFEGARFVQRTARCNADLALLELWFDVTHAAGTEE